jgi:uncharacterized protein (TIGR03118 family)
VIVDVFDTNGNFVRRVITEDHLSAPWGITLAPAAFGEFGGALLVGNFGEGTISAFEFVTGTFLRQLLDTSGQPLVNDGLWAINFRAPGSGFESNALFFFAGIETSSMDCSARSGRFPSRLPCFSWARASRRSV